MTNEINSSNGVRQRGQPSDEVLVDVRDLKMHFPVTEGIFVQSVVAMVQAVNGISFQIMKGETLGLVGESGLGVEPNGGPTTGRRRVVLREAGRGCLLPPFGR